MCLASAEQMRPHVSEHAHKLSMRVSRRVQARRPLPVRGRGRVQGDAPRVHTTVRESSGLVQLQMRHRLREVDKRLAAMQAGGRPRPSSPPLHQQLLPAQHFLADQQLQSSQGRLSDGPRSCLRLQPKFCLRDGRGQQGTAPSQTQHLPEQQSVVKH